MDYSKRRCGECGNKSFSQKNVHGIWNRPWKDFPVIFMTNDHFVWTCDSCGNEGVDGSSGAETDELIEKSIRNQASQFLDVIKSKSGLNFEELAKRLGITPSYISELRKEKKTPSYSIWTMLKLCARYPEHLKDGDVLDPQYDIERANILLRA